MPPLAKFAGQVEAAGEGQLIADLVEGDDAFEFAHDRLRLGDASARRGRRSACRRIVIAAALRSCPDPRRQHARACSISVRHRLLHRFAQSLVLEIAVLVEGLAGASAPSTAARSPPSGSATSTARRWLMQRMPAKCPSDDEQMPATLPASGLSGLPPSLRTRLTQSMVFFSSGGIEPLYSGVAISTPSWAAISRASFTAFSGTPFSFSRSWSMIGSG